MRRGFTLIELLVVIAILAAILFPVFANAGDKALPQWPAIFDFSKPVPGLELHQATVDDGLLRCDATKQAWASIPLPPQACETKNLRLSARFRLDHLAAGQVPAMIFGRAALYVLSDGRPLGLFWNGPQHSGLRGEVKIEPGQWYEMILDYREGGLLSLYLNGELVARRLALAPLQPGENRLVLGRWQWQEKGQWQYSYLKGSVQWVKVEESSAPTLASLEPPLHLAKHVSWGDIILEGQATDKDSIRALLQDAADKGFEEIHWRLSAAVIRDYHQRSPEETWPAYIRRYYQIVDSVYASFDPIAEACKIGHELGLQMLGWLTIFDEGAPPSVLYAGSVPFPWQSKFTIEHPEYLVRDKQGTPHWGVLEYAYPEARRYMVAQIVDYAQRYDLDGIFISTRTHSPPAQDADRFGFNSPIVEAYRERYGQDLLGENFDRDSWRRLRGEQVTKLLRELRAAMPEGKRIAIGIPRGDWFGPPYGNMYIDWRTWVAEGLINELVIGEISGKGLYPDVKDYRGYIFDQEAGLGLRPLLEDVEKVFGPPCREHGVRLYVQGMDGSPAFWKQLEEGTCGLRM